jgi:uncharacterized metal-binding protein YceD (DUF177 family)
MTNIAALPEHKIHVRVLPQAGFGVSIEATEREREQIAAHCGIPSIGRLHAELTLRRWRADGVSISGRLTAALEQECVVTLAPVAGEIDVAIDRTLLPAGSALAKPDAGGEMILDPQGDDAPDTFDGAEIDLWPIIAETLLLSLDPYPRAPGARLDPAYAPHDDPAEAAGKSPFAALAARMPKS